VEVVVDKNGWEKMEMGETDDENKEKGNKIKEWDE
jgi:hypothetical protein